MNEAENKKIQKKGTTLILMATIQFQGRNELMPEADNKSTKKK